MINYFVKENPINKGHMIRTGAENGGREMINVKDYIVEYYPDDAEDITIFTEDLDEAFIGIGYVFNGVPRACYDKNRIIEILINRDSMTPEVAEEYFEFNIASLYAGKRTPMIIEVI
jgi:hypothetical protein